MSYTVNVDTATEPTNARGIGQAAEELRALKAKVNKIFAQTATPANNTFIHVTAEIALSNGSSDNEAHSLSTPVSVEAFLICKTTDLGYAVGEIVQIDKDAAFVSITASNVYLHQVSTPNLPDRGSSNALSAVTPANWRYVVVAKSK